MKDRSAIRNLLLRSRLEAEQHMENIRSADPLTYETLHEELYRFVLIKYLLSDEDRPDNDSFSDLAELSLSKSMKVSPALVEEFDAAASCDGATSVMAKKVLLFMAIQRELNIELPAAESARIKTMHDLSRMVWNTLKTSPENAGRLAE
ncbi:MAG: hypothetical protein IKG70_05150 [Lachnospiraceae bacterium]|nr:hypothetical protein [Parasporobacterium sp.]MBR3397220.1 hypothetical protein [Lachnospiraceae bacterium]